LWNRSSRACVFYVLQDAGVLRAGGLPVDGVAAVAVLLQREVAVRGTRLAVVVLVLVIAAAI
jgi:hypothetical protein